MNKIIMVNNRIKIARVLILSTFFWGTTHNLFGQVLPMIQTDRPDQTECPFIVPKNYFQIESGFNYEKVNKENQNLLYPTILWKYGVNEKFELRLISELTTNKNIGENLTGINPIKIGFKTKLIEQNGLIPQTSFIGHLAIPFLSTSNLTTTYFAPSFRFTMQHTLTEKISLGYNLGAEWNGEDTEATFIYTLTSGISLTEKVGAYIELYGFAPQKQKLDHRFDGGITFFPKPNIMFDISGGFGLTENTPIYYSSLGFSIRLPN